jgi:mono/diheme cytochrome c family protein
MPRFRDIPMRDLRAVASFVAAQAHVEPNRESRSQLALGNQVFQVRCAACHGVAGRGDGPAAGLLGRKPADFSRKQPTEERVRLVLLNGIPGTAMTAMQQNLSLEDLDALTVIVRSLWRTGTRQMEADQ